MIPRCLMCTHTLGRNQASLNLEDPPLPRGLGQEPPPGGGPRPEAQVWVLAQRTRNFWGNALGQPDFVGSPGGPAPGWGGRWMEVLKEACQKHDNDEYFAYLPRAHQDLAQETLANLSPEEVVDPQGWWLVSWLFPGEGSTSETYQPVPYMRKFSIAIGPKEPNNLPIKSWKVTCIDFALVI